MSKRIKNALISVLAGIQLDAGGGPENAFVQVVGDTSTEFDGYPSIRVMPGELDTQKASVAENERTVSFDLYVHLPLEANPATEAATYDRMYDLTDLIIDALDEGDYQGALNQADPTIKTYFLEAQKGDWRVTQSKGGALLLCRLSVNVRYSKLL